jgi:arylsulfatase A-like enzyme
MLESVGLQHLGFEGYARKVTPNIDELSELSVRFRQARTTATHSNYAQMAVLSSLFPRRYSGLDTYRRLDYPRVLWHDFLSVLGYATATHSSQDESWQGMIRFQNTETSTSFHHAGNYEGKRMRLGSERVVPDEVTATRLMQWIDGQTGPWGAYVNFQSTHFPYKVPEGAPKPFTPDQPGRGTFRYLKYPKADLPIALNRYDNALSYVDAQIGRILDYLRVTGKLENTILVLTSDHGELFFEHGMVTHGRSLFEGELRVPLMVHYPKALVPHDVDQVVSTLDVLPTIAEILNVPAHPAFQGQSLLSSADDPERPQFMNIQGMKSVDGVICGTLKFIDNRSLRRWELYDLSLDPEEKHNLVETHRAQAEALHDLVRSQMNAQMSYYAPSESSARELYYAPRLANCPSVDDMGQVSLAQGRVSSAVAN